MINQKKYNVYRKYDGDFALFSDRRTSTVSDINLISEKEFKILESIEINLALIKTRKCSSEICTKLKSQIQVFAKEVEQELFQKITADLAINQLKLEVWISPDDLTSLLEAGPNGNGARNLLESNSKIIHYIYASSNFDAMTQYYAYMDWGTYTTEHEYDYEPYVKTL